MKDTVISRLTPTFILNVVFNSMRSLGLSSRRQLHVELGEHAVL